MTNQLIVLCPGQGAQKAGMGKAWFDASSASKAIFEEADAILGDSLGLQEFNSMKTKHLVQKHNELQFIRVQSHHGMG